jgi:hypothetical protein
MTIQKTCYYDSKEIILKILRSEKLKNAKKLFNNLMNHLDKIPKDLADFMKNKIKPNFNSYMRHLKFDFLPTTNNKMENYFGVTLSRHLKKNIQNNRRHNNIPRPSKQNGITTEQNYYTHEIFHIAHFK